MVVMVTTINEINTELQVAKNDIKNLKERANKLEDFRDKLVWFFIVTILLGVLGVLAKSFGFI
ncbi:hypothetical protein KKG83_07380 [Candidatus Micrarchaeota archaeon]|nr:hypothetical protein [Candidatus Micrarchaeota archaeon]MBU2477263.1 hypothetical protein [Candidatus Micrarchaeota archaeon]